MPKFFKNLTGNGLPFCPLNGCPESYPILFDSGLQFCELPADMADDFDPKWGLRNALRFSAIFLMMAARCIDPEKWRVHHELRDACALALLLAMLSPNALEPVSTFFVTIDTLFMAFFFLTLIYTRRPFETFTSQTVQRLDQSLARQYHGMNHAVGKPLLLFSDQSHKMTPALSRYLESCENSPIDMSRLKKKQINRLESKYPEFLCCFGLSLMNKPVRLDDRLYDYDNIIMLPEISSGIRIEPFTRDEFTLREIQPAREIRERIIAEVRKASPSNTLPVTSRGPKNPN